MGAHEFDVFSRIGVARDGRVGSIGPRISVLPVHDGTSKEEKLRGRA